MNAVRNVRFAVLALVLSAVGALSAAGPARADDGDAYAVIVFSTNGKYAFARKAASKDEAIDKARSHLPAGAVGELTAVWAKNGYVALAIGENNTVEAAAGATQEDAENNALKHVRDAGDVNPHIVIVIASDGD